MKDTSCTMALARLSLLSLLFVSLVGSQPADDSEVLSNLATSDLSFPWSRLRLPRYLSKSFFKCTKMKKRKNNWSKTVAEKAAFSHLYHILCFLLHRYIVPLHYHLLLHPNLTSLSFKGSVQIQIDVQNNTNWVVLHSKGLNILQATVLDQDLAHLSDQVGLNVVQISLSYVRHNTCKSLLFLLF